MTATDLKETAPNVPARNVLESLRAVIDPELGIDIVNLGLVYGVSVKGGSATITMTLTTPGCPLHAIIEADVRSVLGEVPGIEEVTVDLVWEPPWTPAVMSDEAKRALGFYL